MPQIQANGIHLEYDTFGSPDGRPLLLIMGLGSQMIRWPEDFCADLAGRGHFVVRFDNRDVGLSEKLDHLGRPRVGEAFAAFQAGEPFEPPYTLEDMAEDAVGLLDALGLDTAHVCGASMGGMIAQQVALRHPHRVRSLTSLESTTGARDLPPPTPEALAALLAPPVTDRAAAIAQGVATRRGINGTWPFDEAAAREAAASSYDRCHHPDGVARQYLAAFCGTDRTAALRSLAIPTLVVHGREDPLIPVAHGEATAAAIPGAALQIIDGWGHGLHARVLPLLLDAISTHTERTDNGH